MLGSGFSFFIRRMKRTLSERLCVIRDVVQARLLGHVLGYGLPSCKLAASQNGCQFTNITIENTGSETASCGPRKSRPDVKFFFSPRKLKNNQE